ISLLENSQSLQANDRIGLFSYGSGSVAEFFSMRLIKGYQEHLLKKLHETQFKKRSKLSIEQYEAMFSDQLDTSITNEFHDQTPYSITKLVNTIRQYKE
ncbi:MAG: hydroxymethylglutaryl-CoA synthase, partial [Lactococcus sp.]|nr:hydroxymethylglutaryl-CoA synthase [Lactococcus sp.]